MAKKTLTEALSLDETLLGLFDDLENSVEPQVITFNDLWIRPKEGDKINFGANLNVNQKAFLEHYQINPFERFSLRGLRGISLKGRQLGITTLIAALFFCDTVNHPLRYSVIMAHDDVTTKKIFEIVKRFYDNLPEDKKPQTRYNTKTDLTFDKIDSQIYVLTAGTKSVGQGTTPNNVLCSEYASYPDPQQVKANLLQGVPKSGSVFIESTAEGVGNDFHIEYLEAEEGDSNFSAHFFPWFMEPEYTSDVPENFVPTPQELVNMEKFNLTLGQIVWYRGKAKELRHEVGQEYPFTPEEAFISSGGDFFNPEILAEYITTAKTLKTIALPGIDKLPLYYKECEYPRRAKLLLWELPVAGHKYLISADSSEGEEDTKSDFSSADILDVDTCTQVGHLHGKLEPHVLGKLCVELGYFFNTALIVPERNNHGHTVINEILNHTNYPKMDVYGWGGLYFHKEYDAAKRQHTTKPGLPTTSRSKFLILDALNDSIINRELAISNYHTLIEMKNYKSLGKGKYGAPPGLKDDRVMSIAIGAYIMQNRPKPIVRQPAKELKKGSYI